MAKKCPERNGEPVIYLTCAECDKKDECRKKSKEMHDKKQKE